MQEQQVQHIPIDHLVCREQPRKQFDVEELVALAGTIREHGVMQPLLARREKDSFILLDGERRLRAAKMAGLEWVPVIIDDRDLAPSEILLRQLVLDCQRADLKPLERARAIQKLITESNWHANTAAKQLGLSESTVSRWLALLALSPEEQTEVEAGKVPASTAYELVKVRDPAERKRLVGETVRHRLSRDRVARRARHIRRPSPTNPQRRPIVERARFVVPVGESRSVTIAGPQARRDNESAAGPVLTLEELAAWVDELAARLKTLREENLSLPDAIKALASRSP